MTKLFIKKQLAAILVLVLLPVSWINCSASLLTYTDFSEYVEGIPSAVMRGHSEAINNVMSLQAATGVNGRNLQDKSFSVKFNGGIGYSNPFYSLRNGNVLAEQGEIIHLKVSLAAEIFNFRTLGIGGRLNIRKADGTATTGFLDNGAMAVSIEPSNGVAGSERYVLKAFGINVIESCKTSTFYSVDLLVNTANHTMDVFVNGVNYFEDKPITAACATGGAGWTFKGFSDVRLNLLSTAATHVYFDDIGVWSLSEGDVAEIDAPVEIIDNELINLTESGDYLIQDADMTAGTLLSGLQLPASSIVTIIDAYGNELSGNDLITGYNMVRSVGLKSTYLYKVTSMKNSIFSETFDSMTIGAIPTNNWNYMLYQYTNYLASIGEGVGGKNEENKNLHFLVMGADEGSLSNGTEDPYIQRTISSGNITGENLVIETSVFMRDYNASRLIRVEGTNESGQQVHADIMLFDTDETVKTGAEMTNVGMYRRNEWYRITAVVDTITLSYDLYIDGEKLDTQGLALFNSSSPLQTITNIMFKISPINKEAEKYKRSETYFDDVNLWNGTYMPASGYSMLNISGYTLKDSSIYYSGENILAKDIPLNATCPNPYTLYLDDDYEDIPLSQETLRAGAVLVVHSPDMKTIHYYKIRRFIGMDNIRVISDGSEVSDINQIIENQLHYTVALWNETVANQNAIIVLSSYKNEKLVDIHIKTFNISAENSVRYQSDEFIVSDDCDSIEVWAIDNWKNRVSLSEVYILSKK